MSTSVMLHEDAFYEYFKPYRHPDACHDIWGGLGLETFGKDLDTVRKLDLSYVWTVLDGDSSNDQWISPGFHFVNRICYLVTEISHQICWHLIANGCWREAATWTYVNLMNHWNHKHAQTAYIPSLKHTDPRLQYSYGNSVRLGEGADFLLVLKAMFQGKVYYDPGIKLEKASSAKPTTKRRSQFRVKSGDLSSLYLKMDSVDVTNS